MNTKNISDFLNTEVKEYVMDVVENRAIPSVIYGQNGQLDGQNRQLKEKYENQIHNLPYKQSEFNELKKKYEKLQLDYFALKNGKEVKESEKPKEQKSHNWWEEI